MSGFHFMNEKLQFFALFQKLQPHAARITIVQLRWNFPNFIFNQLANYYKGQFRKNRRVVLYDHLRFSAKFFWLL